MILANAIAAAVSRQISYGNMYTTKLLRRGIDIERREPIGDPPAAAGASRAG